jgi:hypothetical protein
MLVGHKSLLCLDEIQPKISVFGSKFSLFSFILNYSYNRGKVSTTRFSVLFFCKCSFVISYIAYFKATLFREKISSSSGCPAPTHSKTPQTKTLKTLCNWLSGIAGYFMAWTQSQKFPNIGN